MPSPFRRCRRRGARPDSPLPVTPDEDASLPAVVLRGVDSVVEIRYVGRGATTSVMVTDVRTGDRVVLDATELESLVRGPHAELRRLLTGIAGDGPGAS